MSDQTNNLSGKVGLDVTDYKAGVSEMNRQIRVIESGFRAQAATMAQWDKSAEGLEARNKSLTDVMGLQEKKIWALRNEYAKIVSEKGADSRAAEELLIKINKETEAFNKNQTELDKNEKALKDNASGTKKLGDEETAAEKKTISFKDSLSGMGKVASAVAKTVVGVGTAVAGAVGAIAGGFLKMAAAADDIAESAEKAGITVEKYQELDYIGKQLGIDTGTLTGSFEKMLKSQKAATTGSGEQYKALRRLKVDAIDPVTGSMRDSQTVYWETIEALRGIEDPTERNSLAMSLLGKSSDELRPLLNATDLELKAMENQAKTLGAVMSDKAVKGLADFNDQVDSLKSGIKGVAGEIAAALLPGFQNIATGLKGYLSLLKNVVVGSDGDISKMASGIGGLLGKIFNDLAAGMPEMMNAGMAVIQGLLDAIMTAIPVLIPAAITVLMNLVNFILQNLPMLVDAAFQIILMLANGITTAIPKLIPALVDVVVKIVKSIITNLPLLLVAALELILALAQGIVDSIPALIEAVPTLISSLVLGIVENLPTILLAAIQIILALAKGIVENIPLLVKMTPQLLIALVNEFKSRETWSQMMTAGKALIDGIWEGFKDSWEFFKENVLKKIADFIKGIKEKLGIASPSKIFAGIGMNLPLGMEQGWNKSFKDLRQTVSQSVTELYNVSASGFNRMQVAGAGSQVSNSQESYAFYAPVILQGAAGQSLGGMVKAKR